LAGAHFAFSIWFWCEQRLGRPARLCPALAIIRNAGGGVLAAVYAPAWRVIFDHMFG
jgi:hypothetical protein